MDRRVLRFFLPPLGILCAAEEATPIRFPLEAGCVWVYRGRVTWTEADNQVRGRDLQWQVKVLAVVKGKGRTIALIQGWPADLAWFEPDKGPGTYVAIHDSEGLALISGEAAQRVWDTAQPKAALKPGGVDPGNAEQWLPARLREGAVWGEADSLARTDGLYVYRVEEVGTLGLDGLGGWAGPPRGTFFRIAYRTNPDHTVMDYVPGLGFTRYTYAHHGTVSTCDLRLVAVEFPRMPRRRP